MFKPFSQMRKPLLTVALLLVAIVGLAACSPSAIVNHDDAETAAPTSAFMTLDDLKVPLSADELAYMDAQQPIMDMEQRLVIAFQQQLPSATGTGGVVATDQGKSDLLDTAQALLANRDAQTNLVAPSERTKAVQVPLATAYTKIGSAAALTVEYATGYGTVADIDRATALMTEANDLTQQAMVQWGMLQSVRSHQ